MNSTSKLHGSSLRNGIKSKINKPVNAQYGLKSTVFFIAICILFLHPAVCQVAEEAEFIDYLEGKKQLIKSAQSFIRRSYSNHPDWTKEQLDSALAEFIKKKADVVFGGLDVRTDGQQYKESLTKRTIEGAQFDLDLPNMKDSDTSKIRFILAATKIYKIDSFSNHRAYQILGLRVLSSLDTKMNLECMITMEVSN